MSLSLTPRRETRAFLQLNDYYLLFADPVIPFVGRSGRLLAPACTVASLLGMSPQFDAEQGRVLIEGHSRRTLLFTAGDPVADSAGSSVPLGEPPVLLPPASGVHDLLVPVDVLASAAAEVTIRRDAQTRTLHVDGASVLKQIEGFGEQGGYTAMGHATRGLAPVALELRRGRDVRGRPAWEVVFTARNISGEEIPRGGAWIKTIDFTPFTSVGVGGVPYNSPEVHTPTPPAVPPSGTITTTVTIGGGYSPGGLRFIVAQPQRAGGAGP